MSQRVDVEIPVRLSFRPYCARWTTCSAELLGWREKPTNTYSEPDLEWLNPPDDRDRIRVRLDVPSAQDLASLAYAFGCRPSGRSYTIDIVRRLIPPYVLPPHADHQSTPNIAGRRFDVLVCLMQESEEFAGTSKLKQEREKNAWEMRDEFLNLGREIFALERFLEKWGLWSRSGVFDRPVLESPNWLWARQEEYRRALAGKPHTWLGGTRDQFNLSMSNERPYFKVRLSYCEEAIKATITIDHLRKVRFGICRRHDCRRLFKRTSRQKRFYCKPECAHLANVRKLRAQKKKLESKESKHATR